VQDVREEEKRVYIEERDLEVSGEVGFGAVVVLNFTCSRAHFSCRPPCKEPSLASEPLSCIAAIVERSSRERVVQWMQAPER